MIKLIPSGDKYELYDDYQYGGIVVPKGYKTDGISYKLRLVALFINKFDPRFIEAVVVHDYLCELELYKLADRYFEELLPNCFLSKIMVNSVKMYHYIKYGIKF